MRNKIINFIITTVPIIDVLWNYNGQFLAKDLVSSLTMVPVIIPQSMAYALIAGVPPVYGLYASTVPTIFYAIFATSRHLAVGKSSKDSLNLFCRNFCFDFPFDISLSFIYN